MSSPSKHHDPLFHYETHFPERLSRLHLTNEFGHASSFKKARKTRQRTGIRYKTQPITFDEITEVDEEPSGAEEKQGGSSDSVPAEGGRSGGSKPARGLMGQFQAFSRSMDGLLPRIPEQVVLSPVSLGSSSPRRHHHHPHTERPPSIPSIPEKVESANRSPGVTTTTATTTSTSAKLGSLVPTSSTTTTTTTTTTATTRSPSTTASGLEDRLQQTGPTNQAAETPTNQADGDGGRGGTPTSPPQSVPPANIGSRRQKVTAKAKKRQKAAEEQKSGNGGKEN